MEVYDVTHWANHSIREQKCKIVQSMISERSKSRNKHLIESIHEEEKHANNKFLIMPLMKHLD